MRKNVLLVDDDHIFNFLNEKIIARIGFANEIHTASNGQEAINIISRLSQNSSTVPEIIFLDLNMPVMDGFEFIEIFNTMDLPEQERMVIIVVSSSADPRDVEKVQSMGVKHYISKPVTEESIRLVLSKEFSF
jgi:CheY-like chemotaxis protein